MGKTTVMAPIPSLPTYLPTKMVSTILYIDMTKKPIEAGTLCCSKSLGIGNVPRSSDRRFSNEEGSFDKVVGSGFNFGTVFTLHYAHKTNPMKTKIYILPLALALIFGAVQTSCKSSSFGKVVKQPFSGSKYESDKKWFRAVGSVERIKDNIARDKAELDAKQRLAGQVETNMRRVADQYLSQTENASNADVADKFQSLVREVMNTNIADLRKFDEVVYQKDDGYRVFVAYEIKKKDMLKFMKKQAKLDKKISEQTRKSIEEMIDEELKQYEDD